MKRKHWVEISKQDFIDNVTNPFKLLYVPKHEIEYLLQSWPDDVSLYIPAHILNKKQLHHLKKAYSRKAITV